MLVTRVREGFFSEELLFEQKLEDLGGSLFQVKGQQKQWSWVRNEQSVGNLRSWLVWSMEIWEHSGECECREMSGFYMKKALQNLDRL